MKHALVLMLLALLAGYAAQAAPATLKAGKYTVDAVAMPDPPKVGSVMLHLTIKDGAKPLDGAEVKVHLDMVEMPMPLDVAATAGEKPGEYVATANLSMAGKWKATVAVAQMAGMAMDGDGKAGFTFDVVRADGGPASSATRPDAPTSPTAPAQGGDITWYLVAGGIVAVAAAILALTLRKPKGA